MSATAFFFEPEPGFPADYPLMQPAGFKRGWTFQRPNPSISSSSGLTTGGLYAGQQQQQQQQPPLQPPQRRRQYPRRPARLSEVAPLSPKSRLVRIALEDESHPCTPRTPLFCSLPDADGHVDGDAGVEKNGRDGGKEGVVSQDENEVGEKGQEGEDGDRNARTGSSLSMSFALSNETRISSRSSLCPLGERPARFKGGKASDGDCYACTYNNDNCLGDEEEEEVDPLQNYEDDYGDEDDFLYGDDYDEEEADDFDFAEYGEIEGDGGYYDNQNTNNTTTTTNNDSNKYYQDGSHTQDHDGNDNISQSQPFSECYSCGSPCEHPSTTTTPPPLGESQHYFIDVHDGLRRKAAYLFCWKCVAVFLSQMHQRVPRPGCGPCSSFSGPERSRGCRESASGSESLSASSVSAGRRSQGRMRGRRSDVEGNGRRRTGIVSAATGQEEPRQGQCGLLPETSG